jgi:CheY-like chemotaxis protein
MAEEAAEPADEARLRVEQVRPGLTGFCADTPSSNVGRSDSGREGEAGNGASNRTARISPKRLLVVEDNHDVAQMLSEVLHIYGYATRVAYDGISALEVAKSFRPDVALVDIGLPAMDGYQLARRLRQLPELRKTRLFAVTGYGQLADRMRSAQAGFDRHLVKPVDLEELRRLIDAAG